MVYRVLAVCTGNICRSPMAEHLLRASLAEAGLADRVAVSSAGTTSWEEGEPIDPRAGAQLARRGIDASQHRARHMTGPDLRAADLILALDADHIAPLRRLCGSSVCRVRLVREFDPAAGEDLGIRDPWYGDESDFAAAAEMIDAAVPGIVAHIRAELEARG